jgi:hypothetical protein
MRLMIGNALGLVLACAAGAACAEEPKGQQPELLPPPKAAPGIVYIMPELPRLGTREVWQYYAVDNRGRFLNRVIYTPDGAFDLRTGMPYPWTTTRPTLHMPYALD